jgi:mercuric ion transport protein
VLTVDDMTCSACPVTVRNALEDVEGVYSVDATYEPPRPSYASIRRTRLLKP